MTPREGGIRRPWLWAVLAVALLGIPAAAALARHLAPALPDYGPVPAFSLTDQTGHTLGTRELAGKVWVVDFIFTSCPSVCPLMSSHMEQLQGKLRSTREGKQVRLISVSVDPDHDTPARLARYAARYHADPATWSFLTGATQKMEDAIAEGFKIGVSHDSSSATDAFGIVHGTKFILVDGRGTIRGYYDARTGSDLDKLVNDAGSLIERGGV